MVKTRINFQLNDRKMSLLQLVYVSTMSTDDPALLHQILDAAVKNNKRNNITGMLLYAEGNIIQAIEGDRDAVLATFTSIEKDTRHRGIHILIEEEILSRKFASWNMGFRQITKVDLETFPASAPLFNMHGGELALRIRPSNALTLLTAFAEASM